MAGMHVPETFSCEGGMMHHPSLISRTLFWDQGSTCCMYRGLILVTGMNYQLFTTASFFFCLWLMRLPVWARTLSFCFGRKKSERWCNRGMNFVDSFSDERAKNAVWAGCSSGHTGYLGGAWGSSRHYCDWFSERTGRSIVWSSGCSIVQSTLCPHSWAWGYSMLTFTITSWATKVLWSCFFCLSFLSALCFSYLITDCKVPFLLHFTLS